MMKSILSILILAIHLFVVSDGSCEQDDSVWIEKETFRINKHLPRMRFEVLIDKGDIKKITIYKEGHKKELQSIDELDPEGECEALGHFNYFAEDINFDGYKDFKFTCWRGATGNESFRYLIYNKSKKKFYFSRELADLAGTKADPKRKVITTFRNQGFAGMLYVAQTFKWINGKLTLIEREKQAQSEEDAKKIIRKKKKRINGKMTVVEQEIININE